MIANKACFQCIVSVNEQHTITGFASYFYAYYSWSGKALYIDDLYVIPACRAQGLGTALWKR